MADVAVQGQLASTVDDADKAAVGASQQQEASTKQQRARVAVKSPVG